MTFQTVHKTALAPQVARHRRDDGYPRCTVQTAQTMINDHATTGVCDSAVQKTVEIPQVQYFGGTAGVPVAMHRQSPVMMRCQVPTIKIKRVLRIMNSTQHYDESVDVFVVKQDRFTDEESAHEHMADSLRETLRTTTKSMMQLLATSCVSCQSGQP